ncbi:MAG TPA: hypothetical protein VM031_01930 [Phycisphaerae bacterium]|nr:hypothetical protein [Phycisphaerae bacterium]
MKSFHHIGLVADTEKPGEMYFESLKVWGTNPDDDPVNKIEWVRVAPDSPLADTPVAKMPHTSWAVDDLDAALEGKNVVVGPLNAAENIRIAYFLDDGALIEYLEVT